MIEDKVSIAALIINISLYYTNRSDDSAFPQQPFHNKKSLTNKILIVDGP